MIHNRIGSGDGQVAEQEQLDRLDAVIPPRSRREVWVGLFVLLGVVATLVILFTLTDISVLRGRYVVATRVEDAAGIRKGDPVQLRGVNIGRIRGFEIVPAGVEILLELEGEYQVPADSRVVLRSTGLLGGTVAEVLPGTAAEALEGGEVLPGATGEGAFSIAEDLGDRVDTVLSQVQSLLSDQTVGAVGESAQELQTLLAELNVLADQQRRELGTLTTSLRRSAAGVENAVAGPELERVVTRIDSITDRVAGTTLALDRASTSLEAVLSRLERGEGTLGRLSTDDSLYVNLNNAAANLDLLVQDIRDNPRRYLTVRVF